MKKNNSVPGYNIRINMFFRKMQSCRDIIQQLRRKKKKRIIQTKSISDLDHGVKNLFEESSVNQAALAE